MYQTLLGMDDLWNELRTLGLLSPEQIETFSVMSGDGDDPAQAIVRLVEAGLLTPYQAEQIRIGKGRRLLVGPYLLRERLGDGGMGRVYKAQHRLMRRVVALKIAARVHGGRRDAAMLGRFRREAEAAARLDHPHIVKAFDAGESRGRRYLAMEYIQGIDLERLVGETGPLPIDLACEIMRQAADALHHAHERGLVHRDIKPSNLMLAPPGVSVKLLDLGLALLTDRPNAAGTSAQSDSTADEMCGTPDFMPPEWGRDRSLDVRGDLYSLGCTFYFLLTGQVPYPGGGWTEKLLKHHLDEPTPIRQLRPDVPAALGSVVERLMARERLDRYPSAAAVANALAALDPIPVEPKPRSLLSVYPPRPRPRRWRRFVMLTCAAVLLGVVVAGAARWLRGASTELSLPRRELAGIAFQIEGRPDGFASPAQAIAAARNGDTIVIQGRGPFLVPPMRWHGKTLTIKARGAERPCLTLKPGDDPWQALLHTDRTLTLEGLDLAVGSPGGNRAATGPLICCEGEPLHLTNCRLTGPADGAAIVVRDASQVSLRNCRIDAGSVGLSLEVGQGTSCRLRMSDCRLTVHGQAGAALSLWSPEVRQAVPVALELQGNTIRADRVAACRALPAGLTISASANHFVFRSSLLSYAGYGDHDIARTGTVWRGTDNSYDGPPSWLWVEGKPVSLDSQAWSKP
jgi:serine/threonine protein kinase